tara:strand:- start:617 stop:1102 length:486 start_codon:yes stop_codon:yes gene_type:complete
MPFLIVFLQQLAGGRLFDAAILMALYTALRSVLRPLFGWISDKTGRRGWLIVASFASVYLLYRISLITHFSQFYPIMVLFGIVDAMGVSGGAMVQDESEGKHQGSKINFFSIIFSIGATIGVAFGGHLIELYGFNFVFLVAAGVEAFSSIPLFFFKKGEAK